MAVHALADRATAGTRSCCRCCMHRHGHGIGDADLFNDQVGKIGKYRHRLILAQETVSLEILFGPLFYHIAIIEAAEEPNRGSESFRDTFSANNDSNSDFRATIWLTTLLFSSKYDRLCWVLFSREGV